MLWLHGSTDLVGLCRAYRRMLQGVGIGEGPFVGFHFCSACVLLDASVLFGAVDSIAARIGGL